MTHDLKCWPEFFGLVVAGKKLCEVRHDDRGYVVGDCLNLQEFDPITKRYSGSTTLVAVTHIIRGGTAPLEQLPRDMVVMSIVRANQTVLKARVAELEKTLEFYADPSSYHAIAFLMDRPCGGFADDFGDGGDDYDRPMPGELARKVLAKP